VNCGHNPPSLIRRDGAIERLHATAAVLGLFPDWNGCVTETRLETGDILCIYTDGITETTGRNGEEFGKTRLLDTLGSNRELDAGVIARAR
jgi:phosphoserine phosphatase RsbU/P